MRSPALSFLLLGLTLSACAPLQQLPARHAALNLQGAAPDVVVLAMSGRCTQPCRAPRDNYDYLTSRGTLDAVADAIEQAGFTVQVAGYADNAAAAFQPLKVVQPQRGYQALANDFAVMKSRWLSSARPPRVVLLGHSHGSTWLHHLVRNHRDVAFALQIDLDSNCASWILDHGPGLREVSAKLPDEFPAIGACDLLSVGDPPRRVRGKDIVWPNVAFNLEVQSKRLPARTSDSGGFWLNYTFEIAPNTRPDGSGAAIDRFISTREDHSAIAYPNSDAMQWVLARTRDLARIWKGEEQRSRGN
ncbi:hypothetical protein D3875_06880 [Deinococcus cavernae]|uniref:Alpha/beta hydrolase n=1 Tax=Deinococcus cavernae TaxID=2320857 RepID=A0A418V5G8_9DEIO|nr:hypothetical protein [Deinococcus cavernae]RJF71342.1 hypothetical protein D3875_06880 [Deinococcus cavernae]